MKRAAVRGDWKTGPFGPLAPIPYQASFSARDYARIRMGLIPAQMEDKWFIFFEAPSLFLHRSWTGAGIFQVDFEPEGEGARVVRALHAAGQPGANQPNYQARLLGFLVANLLLGKSEPFPVPDGEPNPALVQHVIAGTGYPAAFRPKRPWWKFWG